MATLSVITLAHNEERNIVDCLTSVRWADELLVVDSGSIDKTVELARNFTSKIFTITWEGYGEAKNFALRQAGCDWILWLDADERVTDELAAEIKAVITSNSAGCDAYSVPRRAFFLGKWIRHCGWYPGRVTRLFRRSKGKFSEHRVHEQLLIDGTLGEMQHDILHYTDPSLDHYFTKFNRYTTLAAEEMKSTGRPFSVYDLLVRPPFLFFKMYILRLGFLDGIQGFILCVVSSAYVFTKYAKLWELTHSKTVSGT